MPNNVPRATFRCGHENTNGATPPTAPRCIDCAALATVCHECLRAIALMHFGAIARHPEAGTDCILCEAGEPTYCGDCFVDQVALYRAALRDAKNPILTDMPQRHAGT